MWDKKEKTLTVARDRYGIKPLYYTFQGSTFLFGSEQKALLAHSDMCREIDLEAMLEYFTFQNIFTDKTLLKGIKLLPAGCYGVIKRGDRSGELAITRYWDFNFVEPENPASDHEYREELDRLFKQAVNRQLVTDVEIGAYLSGGMDSGSITAIAAGQLPYIKSFTCGFDLNSASGIELGFDERRRAEYMSYLFKTEGSVELRTRFANDFGFAVFVDAGTVDTSVFPSFEDRVLFGAGPSFRYFTPVGPLRLDIGFPLNPRGGVDDPYQVYFSIGQAF